MNEPIHILDPFRDQEPGRFMLRALCGHSVRTVFLAQRPGQATCPCCVKEQRRLEEECGSAARVRCCVECNAEFFSADPIELFCQSCRSNPSVCRQNEPPMAQASDPNDDIQLAAAGDRSALHRVPRASRLNFQD